jgi:hypothetical protein
MTETFRHAGLSVLAVIGLIHAAQAAPGNGPPPGGGFNPGFSGPSPRGPGTTPDHSDGYDYSGPSFSFSVRRAHHPADRRDDGTDGADDQQRAPPKPEDDTIWQRFRNGFGLFGPGE